MRKKQNKKTGYKHAIAKPMDFLTHAIVDLHRRLEVIYLIHNYLKVVIIINLEQKQKSASNAENTTDLIKTLQVPS